MRPNTSGSSPRTAQRSSHSRARATTAAAHRRNVIRTLRCAYFAQAGESAARYCLTFDRVVEHLWHARRSSRKFTVSDVAHMDDLVHAVACVEDVPQAWSDLVDRYERTLVRRCRGSVDEMESTVFVRRVLADLRRRSALQFDERLPSLRTYLGTRPLRLWLADRMIGARSWARLLESCSRQASSRRPLRLVCTASGHDIIIDDDDRFPPLMPVRHRQIEGPLHA